jgi:hypothetical protein
LIAGRVVACQLLGLVDLLKQAPSNSITQGVVLSDTHGDIQTQLCSVVPRLYDALSISMLQESEAEVDLWTR